MSKSKARIILTEQTAFIPHPKIKKSKRSVRLDFTSEEYTKLVELARKHDCSLKSFCKQAVAFAVERLELDRMKNI